MTMTAVERATAIAHLNDRARLGLDRNARIVITASCLATFSDGNAISVIVAQAEILKAVRKHAFANDAYGECDFGVLELRDTQIMFKIDLYEERIVKDTFCGSFPVRLPPPSLAYAISIDCFDRSEVS